MTHELQSGSRNGFKNKMSLSLKQGALLIVTTLMALHLEAATLADHMQTIALELRSISQVITDVSKNTDSAARAEKVAQAFTAGKLTAPSTIAEFPANEQAAALARYEQLMQDAANLAQELVVSLRENRNGDAQKVLAKLMDLRKTGHGEFKP